MGIAGWLVILTADAVVAWALYVFLKPINKSLSLLAAWFRVIFVAIFGFNLLNLFGLLQLFTGSGLLPANVTNQHFRIVTHLMAFV